MKKKIEQFFNQNQTKTQNLFRIEIFYLAWKAQKPIEHSDCTQQRKSFVITNQNKFTTTTKRIHSANHKYEF